MTMTDDDVIATSGAATVLSGGEITAPPCKDRGTNTPTVERKNIETETVAKETKQSGTYTFVATIEKATYMAQPVVVSTGTSTPTKIMATKRLNTPLKQYVNASTNTPAPGRALEVPTAFRGGRYQAPVTVSRGTNTVTRQYRDTGSDVIKTPCREVGVLKRPHTLTRGIGTPKVKQTTQGTSPIVVPSPRKDAGCTADLPAAVPSQQDGQIVHRATRSLSLHLVDRESSPVR